MPLFEKGDKVLINLGYKIKTGIVVKDCEKWEKYILVKHDNFLGECFYTSQVSKA